MALFDLDPAERHRQIAAGFTDRVRGAKHWDAPAPVTGWTARDVVRHLVEWFPPFLAAGTSIELPHGPDVDEDPVAAWQTQWLRCRHCWTTRKPHTDRLPTRTPVSYLSTRRSTASTPPTCSCTPGTWPVPPGRTISSIPSSARYCWPVWSRSKSCCGPRVSTVHAYQPPTTPTLKRGCSASSVATRFGHDAERLPLAGARIPSFAAAHERRPVLWNFKRTSKLVMTMCSRSVLARLQPWSQSRRRGSRDLSLAEFA
jgi:hypothetical protein